MKKLLVVRAHPLDATASRTMRLTDAFLEAYRAANPDDLVEDINLYKQAVPEIDIDLLNGWKQLREGTPFTHLHELEQAKVTLFDNYTMQFLSSDRVVVANPLWNLQVPTRLKAWIDTICVAGKTFSYSEDGRPVGLATGKKALHIQASGGVFEGNDPASQYVRTMLGFVGVTDLSEVVAEGMDYDPANADAIMDAALAKVIDVARTF